MSDERIPVILSVAGSDPSGGAGIQADLKTVGALGGYGMAVVTALTAQNTLGVSAVHPVHPDVVRDQLRTLLSDTEPDAVKIGMLGSAGVAEVVAAIVADLGCPVVLDPVLAATNGRSLLDDAAGLPAMKALMPHVSLVTPNLPEAARLLGVPVAETVDGMREQAAALLRAGARRVLIKGGHLPAGSDAVDLLLGPDGERLFATPRLPGPGPHGTGCALSSAIAALRPRRDTWGSAVRDAKIWLTGAIAAARELTVGSGARPVHHFHEMWRTGTATGQDRGR